MDSKHTSKYLKIIALALCLIIVIGLSPNNVWAESDNNKDPSKREVVYAVLKSDGSYDKLIVMNQFELKENQEISDYGNYSAVYSLDDKNLDFDGEKVTTRIGPGYWYYRGDLEDKELPWEVKISYKLDGQEVSPEDLTGATGLFALDLEILPRDNNVDLYSKSYMFQFSLSLDKELYSSLSAENASLADAGQNTMVNWVLLPQFQEELKISLTAEVNNFSMPAPRLVALPLAFDAGSFSLAPGSLEEVLARLETTDQYALLMENLNSFKTSIQDLSAKTSTLNSNLKGLGKQPETEEDQVQVDFAELQEKLSQLEGSFSPDQEALLDEISMALGQAKAQQDGLSQVVKEAGTLNTSFGFFMQKLSLAELSLPNYLYEFENQIPSLIGEVFPKYEAISFASEKNQVDFVQFILVLPEIEPELVEAEELEEITDERSFWQKFTDLFS